MTKYNIENKLKLISKLLYNKKNFEYLFDIYFPPKETDISKIKEQWKLFIINKIEKQKIHFYFHTPFCLKKCKYCQYYSEVITDFNILNKYIEYAKNYINYFSQELSMINFS
jgi:coproporphyrinogen III oxidase-like Fe-S oxidoreductase